MKFVRLAQWAWIVVLGAVLCACGGTDPAPSVQMQVVGAVPSHRDSSCRRAAALSARAAHPG